MQKKHVQSIVRKLLKDNDARIKEYVRNGGKEHHYLDGKAQAYEDVLEALTGAGV
jgi:hypothetical protein